MPADETPDVRRGGTPGVNNEPRSRTPGVVPGFLVATAGLAPVWSVDLRARKNPTPPSYPSCLVRDVLVAQDLEIPSWHLVPPIAPPARVLYLGAGGGDVAARLALTFGLLLVVEPSLERASATRARSEALGVGQVRVACGDGADLPVHPGSLDLAVLDAPQAGTARFALGHSADRLHLLASIHSALKPGAFLCLRVHSGSGDGSMSAQGLSRLATLLAVNRYRRLLRDCAYGEIRVWCAYPDCGDPKFIVEWNQHIFDYFVRHFGTNPKARFRVAAQRILNAARLLKYTAPGYLLLARRPAVIAT